MKRYKMEWIDLEQTEMELMEDERGEYTDYKTAADLLAALTQIRKIATSAPSDDPEAADAEFTRIMEIARAAISKAEA